jgi:hypothetical protein
MNSQSGILILKVEISTNNMAWEEGRGKEIRHLHKGGIEIKKILNQLPYSHQILLGTLYPSSPCTQWKQGHFQNVHTGLTDILQTNFVGLLSRHIWLEHTHFF